ncbi:DUF3168 domain-containing protein [Lactobacillus selangorensis]|uniref:DUF3168 domain-containing protein n=1 Tax=Lactobacillus selangorensis TaxID=81857 RepID=UPI00070B753E|nr:DUF3168 domain-containing protein [Lactobacillus selangorensis]
MKTPDQELFDFFYKASLDLGYSTYDHLEMDDIPYPFVVVSDTQIVQDPNKTAIAANVSVTIDVWGNQKQRQTVSKMLNSLLQAARKLDTTTSYQWAIRNQASSPRIIGDTSTGSFLFHGILDVEMKLI